MALIENIQRESLNPLEEARALKRVHTEFDLSQQEVATAVGKSRPVIANLLRLLSLEREVSEMLEGGQIDAGHGKVLLALDGGDQIRAARKVVDNKLSVRQTEMLVKAMLTPAVDTARSEKTLISTGWSDNSPSVLAPKWSSKIKMAAARWLFSTAT